MPELITDDGLRIAYDVWGDVGDRPPVVLHHGFAANAFVNWVRPGLVDALAGAGHHVVALDARGHGRSDTPHDPARYGHGRMADDVQQLVDHLGFERYDLAGYSMGGVVSATVASRDHRVQRLVLGGVGGALVDRELVGRRQQRMARVVDGLEATDASQVSDPSGAAFRNFAKATGADLLALAAVARGGGRERIAVENITAPTLVLVGDDDALAQRADLLAAAIEGATLTVVPGNHLSAVAKPEFRDALVAFFA
ncbi:MAG TPA: alpha/beta hydrolase [Acidimicrobiia bacterium]|jgi:pimeloyl-ACP methyl ester carboxylesterase